MEAGGFLEPFAKRWPGILKLFGLVTIIAGVITNHREQEGWESWDEGAALIAASLLLFWAGTYLDPIVFNPIYGVTPPDVPRDQETIRKRLKRWWRHVGFWMFRPIRLICNRLPRGAAMSDKREEAADRIWQVIAPQSIPSDPVQRCDGIYNAAKTLFEDSEEWEHDVKPWLESSKVIRSLVFPLLALTVYNVLHSLELGFPTIGLLADLQERLLFGWFQEWGLSLTAAIVALVLYVWLRVVHMYAMYKFVTESDYFPLFSQGVGNNRTIIPAKHLAIGEPRLPKGERRRPQFLILSHPEQSR